MRSKLGIYIPMYGGWLRGVEEGEEEPSYRYAAETALKAEQMGIHSIWVPDHMLNPLKGERAKALEAWTTLTALGAITKRVELFHTTLCQAFRYPTVLAKMAATLDDVSNGRFRFALGAGWFEREFEAYGVPWEDHDIRIDRSREQIEIIKSLWTQPTTNYSGRFYQVIDGILEPKPIQKPHPPIWWGGESEKSRQLVADLADGWLMRNSTPQELEEKMRDMRRRLEERERGAIEYAMPCRIFIGKTDDEAKRTVERLAGNNLNLLKDILARGLVGSPQTVREGMHRLSDVGLSYIILQVSPAIETMRRLEEDVMRLL